MNKTLLAAALLSALPCLAAGIDQGNGVTTFPLAAKPEIVGQWLGGTADLPSLHVKGTRMEQRSEKNAPLAVSIAAIPHKQQRYETVGDWYTGADNLLVLRVSQMSDRRYELLVAVHELVEEELCRQHGVTAKMVDDFDIGYNGKFEEPGDDPAAPYHAEHRDATVIERGLAKMLGVDWEKYADAIEELDK